MVEVMQASPSRTGRTGASLAPLAVGAGFGEVCQEKTCTPKWQVLRNSTPAEIGDALSGVGSVLALIWVIVTDWMAKFDHERALEALDWRLAQPQFWSKPIAGGTP